jgi:hypothetical protein
MMWLNAVLSASTRLNQEVLLCPRTQPPWLAKLASFFFPSNVWSCEILVSVVGECLTLSAFCAAIAGVADNYYNLCRQRGPLGMMACHK